MPTANQITTRLESLYQMRDSGILITRHGDTSVQFRSLDELLIAISRAEADLARASGKRRSNVSYIVQRTKGYGC